MRYRYSRATKRLVEKDESEPRARKSDGGCRCPECGGRMVAVTFAIPFCVGEDVVPENRTLH